MGIHKPKPVAGHLLKELEKESWIAKRLVGDAIPDWLKRFEYVYASGDCGMPCTETLGGESFSIVVAGLCVARLDFKDSPFIWNLDQYVVTSGNSLKAYGPFKTQGIHRQTELPSHLLNADTLGLFSPAGI